MENTLTISVQFAMVNIGCVRDTKTSTPDVEVNKHDVHSDVTISIKSNPYKLIFDREKNHLDHLMDTNVGSDSNNSNNNNTIKSMHANREWTDVSMLKS